MFRRRGGGGGDLKWKHDLFETPFSLIVTDKFAISASTRLYNSMGPTPKIGDLN